MAPHFVNDEADLEFWAQPLPQLLVYLQKS